MDRRTFFLGLTGVAGTLMTSGGSWAAGELASKAMPKRVLGRTNQQVSILGLGTAPMGHASVGEEAAASIIHAALDQGINYIDTARVYDNSESYLSKVTRDRRDEMFLVTKVWADSAARAEESLTTSLKTLGVDHVDLCHIHSMGNRNPEEVLADDGALAYLLKAKEKGLTRCVGITGHHKVSNYPPVLDTGKIEVLMVNLNFVDGHAYKFREHVLPVAKKHGTAVVAMKVFAGRNMGEAKNFMANYRRPGPPQMPGDLLRDSLHYCLSLDGVTTALTGVYNRDEILENSRWAKEFQPMTAEKMKTLEERGKEIAPSWGLRFGEPD
jgi:hypothetical protein